VMMIFIGCNVACGMGKNPLMQCGMGENHHKNFFSNLANLILLSNWFNLTCTWRITELGAPNAWVKRPILVDKNQLVKVFYLKATFAKCKENANNKKISSISIWIIGMPKISLTKLAIVGNLCSLIYHQVIAHL
jgi:hypothetical protein